MKKAVRYLLFLVLYDSSKPIRYSFLNMQLLHQSKQKYCNITNKNFRLRRLLCISGLFLHVAGNRMSLGAYCDVDSKTVSLTDVASFLTNANNWDYLTMIILAPLRESFALLFNPPYCVYE